MERLFHRSFVVIWGDHKCRHGLDAFGGDHNGRQGLVESSVSQMQMYYTWTKMPLQYKRSRGAGVF